MALTKVTSTIVLIIAIGYILFIGMDFLVPFILSLLVWFLIKGIRTTMRRVSWIRKNIPMAILSMVAGFLIFAILGGVVKVLTVNIQSITKSISVYEGNLSDYFHSAGTILGYNVSSNLKTYLADLNLSSIILQLATSLTSLFGNAFMIFVYTIFLLIEEYVFDSKLKQAFAKSENFVHFETILVSVSDSISNYLSLKTLVSLLTGFLSYWALFIIGIDAPIFWAFLIFLLNFIPAVGSIVATFFPAAFAVLQYGEFSHAIWVLAVVGSIQLIIGNIVEPRIMGNSLNISPLIVILALSFWGALWGVIGMMLSVPITVIMIIILSEIPSTQPLAVLLTAKGRLGKSSGTRD